MTEQERDEYLLACDGCGRVWDDAGQPGSPHECNCICKDGDENYEAWRDATKAEAFLYHGWWRAIEQAEDLAGFEVDRELQRKLDNLKAALKRAEYPEAWSNLVSAAATAGAYAIAHGRWAVLSDRRNEHLRELLRRMRTCLGTGPLVYSEVEALFAEIDEELAREEPETPAGERKKKGAEAAT